jgi:AbrB family looped-hinge helix DNA binding protein
MPISKDPELSTATALSKGQITLPAGIRRRFGIERGTLVDFYPLADGTIRMVPRTATAAELAGALGPATVHLSLEGMDQVIAEAARQRAQ